MSDQIASMTGSVVATFASRAYVTLLGLLVLPLYLERMGPEAYGLVALYATIQVWLQLLDMGLVATLAREVARTAAGAVAGSDLRQFLRALEGLFLSSLLVAAGLLLIASGWIAERWLQLHDLPPEQASRAIQWMAVAMTARFMGELYRGAISGFERLGWLAAGNAVFGSLRFLGVLPFIGSGDGDAASFFAFQLGINVLELLVLKLKTAQLMAPLPHAARGWNLQSVRRRIGFSMAMSLAMLFWILVSQFDKLMLSGLLSLSAYGAFGLAVAAAAGVLLATQSLADVLVPRITMLQAQDRVEELKRLYRKGTQWTAVVACSVSTVMAVHAERLLLTWTGDPSLANSMAPVLALYALGNAAMAMGALPYYLQLARGQLTLHLVGTGIMLCLLVPAILIGTRVHGAVGAAQAWFAANALYLVIWTAVAHRRFMPGLHLRWLARDVAPVVVATGLCGFATLLLPWPVGRLGCALELIMIAVAILLMAVLTASDTRHALLGLCRRNS